MKNKLKIGFTLSEVLITLVIIGVVAAITVPMLNNSMNDKQYAIGMQKARSTIGEAFRLLTINGEIDKNKSTEEFVKEVIPKYLKLAKTCSTAEECGFSSNIKNVNGDTVSMPTSWDESTTLYVTTSIPNQSETDGEWNIISAATNPNQNDSYFFQTMDGFSVNFFYNPNCTINSAEKTFRYILNGPNYGDFSFDAICFNAVYDMNGSQAPNKVGKDIGFVGSFYNSYETQSEVVLPHSSEIIADSNLPRSSGNNYWLRANQFCKTIDENNKWVLPNINQLSLLYLNQKILRNETSEEIWFWSRTPVPSYPDYFFRVYFNHGSRFWRKNTVSTGYVRCVLNSTLK